MGHDRHGSPAPWQSSPAEGRPRRGWLAAALATALAGCAVHAPYQPFDGADAARLRVRLTVPAEYRSLLSPYRVEARITPRPLLGQACGAPAALPGLRPASPRATATPPTHATGAGVDTVVVHPRAGMVGSPPPEDTEAIELRLPPGDHVLDVNAQRHHGNLSTLVCSRAVVLPLAAGGQYELSVGFDARGRCHWASTQLQGQQFVPSPVRRHGPLAQMCQGGPGG